MLGGFLADEMGLGCVFLFYLSYIYFMKTNYCLSLILSLCCSKTIEMISLISIVNCYFLLSFFLFDGTNILANPGDPSIVQKNANPAKKTPPYFKTNATLGIFFLVSFYFLFLCFYIIFSLVICPPHLVRQWCEEIENSTQTPIHVIVILSPQDLCEQIANIFTAGIYFILHICIIFNYS